MAGLRVDASKQNSTLITYQCVSETKYQLCARLGHTDVHVYWELWDEHCNHYGQCSHIIVNTCMLIVGIIILLPYALVCAQGQLVVPCKCISDHKQLASVPGSSPSSLQCASDKEFSIHHELQCGAKYVGGSSCAYLMGRVPCVKHHTIYEVKQTATHEYVCQVGY